MTALEVARDHARSRARLAEKLRLEARDAWAAVDPARISETWATQIPRLMLLLTGGQHAAAATADQYVTEALIEQGITPATVGRVNTAALSGVASDGRPLESLLAQPGITAKWALARGETLERAMAAGSALAELIGHTQVADAGRVADQVALTARRAAGGYARMVVGKTCSRCLILAGKWYRWNAGFKRHPKCLPAGVAVSGPATLAASRRWYQGELVVLTTASGEQLPITGNHPVLTDRGWVPAHLVEEGDQVVRSTRGQGATALVVPDEDQVPSLIEDLWRPDRMMTLDHVPSAAEDFHGDGGHGEVDVVLADCLLRYGFQPARGKLTEQEQLARGIAEAALLSQFGATLEGFLGPLGAAHSLVRRGGLSAALVGGLSSGADLSGCGHAPDIYASGDEVSAHYGSRDSEAATEAVFALTRAVGGEEIGDRDGAMGPRWDAPPGPLTMQSRVAYASRGQELLHRLAGQVELDRVVQVSRVEWSGHVYNLTSAEGWFSANGLIVSNCDCIGIPAAENDHDMRTDPKRVFASMTEAEQDKAFTKAGAAAIRDGADMNQVVNARRGMQTADGRLYTTESAGPRPRLMPEQIYRDAADADDAIRLLRLHGYLL